MLLRFYEKYKFILKDLQISPNNFQFLQISPLKFLKITN